MQTYAIIQNNIVINLIEYENQPIQPIPGLDADCIAVLANGSSIGWDYVNGQLIEPLQKQISTPLV